MLKHRSSITIDPADDSKHYQHRNVRMVVGMTEANKRSFLSSMIAGAQAQGEGVLVFDGAADLTGLLITFNGAHLSLKDEQQYFLSNGDPTVMLVSFDMVQRVGWQGPLPAEAPLKAAKRLVINDAWLVARKLRCLPELLKAIAQSNTQITITADCEQDLHGYYQRLLASRPVPKRTSSITLVGGQK